MTQPKTHSLTSKLFSNIPIILEKLQHQLRMVLISQHKPKQKIKLDSIDPQDINIDARKILEWSEDNSELYRMILEDGMAAYITNKQFLYEFYNHLHFPSSNISQIDNSTLNLANLKQLNLTNNKIKIFENIPTNLKMLYLDFNQIDEIKIKKSINLQFLSISHNLINDQLFKLLIAILPSLRCINISHNYIADIRSFVEQLSNCIKLQILISFGNPISFLKIYWKYITDNLALQFFDNQKYVKPEIIVPKKQQVKVQEKKQQKKESKKDSKKGGKVQEKVVEEPPKQVIKKQQPQIITQQNFTTIVYHIQISNFQELTTHSGFILDDPSIPENIQATKKQTSYWVKVKFMGKQHNFYDNRISFDSATIEDQEYRLQFGYKIQQKLIVNHLTNQKIHQGIIIDIQKQEPKLVADADSGQLKPVIKQGSIEMKKTLVGCIFVDLRRLENLKIKNIEEKYRYFKEDIVKKQGLFKDPLQNEQQLISKNVKQFEEKLQKIQQEKKKKIQEEEASKGDKKAGKDKKPPAQKKGGKKQQKQVIEKKKIQKSLFGINQKMYCYLSQDKMYKGSKEVLCVSIKTL